jgi:hypothetical protein
MTTAAEIIQAKAGAGEDAFLWLYDSGDCILWPDKDGNAAGRWQVSPEVAEELLESGEVDTTA